MSQRHEFSAKYDNPYFQGAEGEADLREAIVEEELSSVNGFALKGISR